MEALAFKTPPFKLMTAAGPSPMNRWAVKTPPFKLMIASSPTASPAAEMNAAGDRECRGIVQGDMSFASGRAGNAHLALRHGEAGVIAERYVCRCSQVANIEPSPVLIRIGIGGLHGELGIADHVDRAGRIRSDIPNGSLRQDEPCRYAFRRCR